MKNIKEAIRRGLLGLLTGLFLSYTTLTISTLGQGLISLDSQNLLHHYLMYGLSGFYFAAISIYFSIETWSFLRVIITHAASTLPFLPIAYYIGMMPHSTFGLVSFIAIYLTCYLASFVAYFIYTKKQAKQINKAI